jgi:hypothetical protein
MLYFSMLPIDIIKYLYENYCDKDIDIIWRKLWPTIVPLSPRNEVHYMCYAVKNGYVTLLDYSIGKYPFLDQYVSVAVEENRLDILQWATYNVPHRETMMHDGELAFTCACKGYLPMLQWLIAHKCPGSNSLFWHAAINGRIHILEWFKSLGKIHWSTGESFELKDITSLSKYVLDEVADNGHLETLDWLIANKCISVGEISHISIMNGYLDILKWLHTRGLVVEDRSRRFVQERHQVYQWLVDNGYVS